MLLGGIGALVALYLIFSNSPSVVNLAGTLTTFGVAETKALQGR